MHVELVYNSFCHRMGTHQEAVVVYTAIVLGIAWWLTSAPLRLM